MSLLATSYRYEIENCNAKSLQKALARQEFRIKVCCSFCSYILFHRCIYLIMNSKSVISSVNDQHYPLSCRHLNICILQK